jgi:hypothetical protein
MESGRHLFLPLSPASGGEGVLWFYPDCYRDVRLLWTRRAASLPMKATRYSPMKCNAIRRVCPRTRCSHR